MSSPGNRSKGAKTGAVICAIARFAVSLAFLCYTDSGKEFWSDMVTLFLPAIMSGLVGVPIGSFAGGTCNPLLGTVIGAVLSGGVCLTVCVAPAYLTNDMSPSGGLDRSAWLEVLSGFVAMIIAGGVAGGIGASIGRKAGQLDSSASTKTSD